MIALTPNRTGVNDLSNGISVGACFIGMATLSAGELKKSPKNELK